MSEIIDLPNYASIYYDLGTFHKLRPSTIAHDFKGEYLILRALIVESRKIPLNKEMRGTLANLEKGVSLMEENQVKRNLTPQ